MAPVTRNQPLVGMHVEYQCLKYQTWFLGKSHLCLLTQAWFPICVLYILYLNDVL
jgi:hypothetical protein